jgi:hypothetical protein
VANNPDPKDTRVAALISSVMPRAQEAYALAARLADAVRPVFALDTSGRRFEQLGSCVLVKLGPELFAFSAAHVFEPIGTFQVPIGCGDKIHYVQGERFSSNPGPSGTHADDAVDAAVLRIDDPHPRLIDAALDSRHLDLRPQDSKPEFCAAIGFRAKKGKIRETAAFSPQDVFVSHQVFDDDYRAHNIDPARFLAIAYGTDILVEDRWKESPSPRGMSGGAVVRLDGLPVSPSEVAEGHAVPRLSGITTELRKGTGSTPQVLLAARIGFHLGLIHQYCPGALNGLDTSSS